jgi:hypothetical protein
MSLAKPAVACGLVAATLGLSACGITAKPEAGTVGVDRASGSHAEVNDPRKPYLPCLRQHGFAITQFLSGSRQLRAIQIGTAPSGPTVVFEPTPGRAEGDKMEAPDSEMKVVEGCVATGVKG